MNPQITIKPRRVSVQVDQPLTTVIQVNRQGPAGANGSATDFVANALVGYPSHYKELSYSGGNLSAIETWNSAAKTLLLLTQDFSYSDGDLAGVVYTNARTNATLTKTFSYSGGNLSAIEVASGD